MERIVSTCLKSKAIYWNGTQSNMLSLSRIVVDAINSVTNFMACEINVDDIKIEEKLGNTSEIQLIKGIVLDKTIDNSAMPKSIDRAKVLLIDKELDYERPKGNVDIEISSPDQIQLFQNHQYQTILKKVRCIIESKANVVISRKGISDFAQIHLLRAGIISIRRVKENDLLWLQKATGAKTVVDLDDVEAVKSNLGLARKVYEKKVGEDKMVFIDECDDPKSVTVLLRANSKKILDEYHRSILDAIAVSKDFIIRPLVVGGAGSVESSLVSYIRERIVRNLKGKERLVLERFADALEEIPLTIAKNAGMNIMDVAVRLRTLSSMDNSIINSARKPYWYGIDVFNRNVRKMFSDAIEPIIVKEQIMKTAIEVTNMLLRIDDVLISKPVMNTHTHSDGTTHSHAGGNKSHDHFDKLGKKQRPMHHYY
jgi:chaperonin GroEL (HSP60 family)